MNTASVCSACDVGQARLQLLADSVEEVGDRNEWIVAGDLQARAVDRSTYAGAGVGISFASLRRFWAVAANRNSSRAPVGPRSRSRSSFRMRLRWADSISTFLRSRRDTRPSHDSAIARAISRAPRGLSAALCEWTCLDNTGSSECSSDNPPCWRDRAPLRHH